MSIYLASTSCVDSAKWYAIQTFANHERKVALQLERRTIDAFLPTFQHVRKWKDRKVTLQSPLFPGYLFVRIQLENKQRVLSVPGVARIVGSSTSPAPLEDGEISALQDAKKLRVQTHPHRFLSKGTKVRIKSGPFQDFQAFLVENRGNCRCVVSFTQIASSFTIQLDSVDLEPIRN